MVVLLIKTTDTWLKWQIEDSTNITYRKFKCVKLRGNPAGHTDTESYLLRLSFFVCVKALART